MAITKDNIKKWFLLVIGKSILHVEQGVGKFYSFDSIEGYYNDFTLKVKKNKKLVNNLPVLMEKNDEPIFFPVAIFQYGLGAYDLYLETQDKKYYDSFIYMCEWALKNQELSGAWKNFSHIYPDNPYSAMCQGEAASLLLRAHTITKDKKYLDAALRAIDFMILDQENGGTMFKDKNYTYLKEYTHKPVVLNGWIFAVFGLIDINIAVKSSTYSEFLEDTLITLFEELGKFDSKICSFYDINRKIICSRFYHRLHIAQLDVLYKYTNNETLLYYFEKWNKSEKNIIFRFMAFFKKAIQKILEK